jgi:hypothetical protein
VRSRRVPILPLPYMAAALGMALALAFCRGEPRGSSQPAERLAVTRGKTASAESEGRLESDSWTRSRQCAEQAEQIVKRLTQEQRGGPLKIMGWFNHYSPKFQRCFVRVSYFNSLAKSDKEQPLLPFSLFDAFDNREIAFCSSTPSPLCQFLGDDGSEIPGDCIGCQRFVKERIQK